MRMASLALLIFCAVISGWTAALAQIQAHDPQGFAHSEHKQHHGTVSAQDRAGEHPGCAGDHADCRHTSKSVHPMLCAACFAVETQALGITPPKMAPSSPDAMPQAAMIPTDHKPRYPPPKGIFPV